MAYIDLKEQVDTGYLEDWYINSVGDEEPVWTEQHIEEFCNDFIVIPKESAKKYISRPASKKCAKCGNDEFYAHQRVYMDVVVDVNNTFIRNISDVESSIYESEVPYGPYTCTKCGREYDSLDELEDTRRVR